MRKLSYRVVTVADLKKAIDNPKVNDFTTVWMSLNELEDPRPCRLLEMQSMPVDDEGARENALILHGVYEQI